MLRICYACDVIERGLWLRENQRAKARLTLQRRNTRLTERFVENVSPEFWPSDWWYKQLRKWVHINIWRGLGDWSSDTLKQTIGEALKQSRMQKGQLDHAHIMQSKLM